MKQLRVLLAGLLMAACASAASADSRPITLIVTVPPGGSSDALARRTANALGTVLGQSVVVENVTGAGGLVGMQRFLHSPSDGHTLLFINQSLAILPSLYPDSAYDPVNDVEPVGVVAQVPMVLSVSKASGLDSLQALIQRMKAQPGKINFGSGGPGTTAHFAEALFLHMAKVQGEMIQYRGSGPALTDLLAGRIDVVIDQTVTMVPLHKEGRVKALAVAGERRSAQAPDVPTFAEAGLPAFDLAIWNGVIAPKGTPPGTLKKLNEALSTAISRAQFVAEIEQLGANVPDAGRHGPAYFKTLIAQDTARVKDLSQAGAFGKR